MLADGALPHDLVTTVTGNALLLDRAADGVARRQPLTVGLAALAIFALLALGLGSLRLGLVAMVPNVVPVLIFFGVLGTGATTLSLPTSQIGSVAWESRSTPRPTSSSATVRSGARAATPIRPPCAAGSASAAPSRSRR